MIKNPDAAIIKSPLSLNSRPVNMQKAPDSKYSLRPFTLSVLLSMNPPASPPMKAILNNHIIMKIIYGKQSVD